MQRMYKPQKVEQPATVVDGQVFLCGGTREDEPFSRHLWLFQTAPSLQVDKHLHHCLGSRQEERSGAPPLLNEARSQLPSDCHPQRQDLRDGWYCPRSSSAPRPQLGRGVRRQDQPVDAGQAFGEAPLIFRPLHRSVIPKTLCFAMLFLFRSSRGVAQLEQWLEGRSMW